MGTSNWEKLMSLSGWSEEEEEKNKEQVMQLRQDQIGQHQVAARASNATVSTGGVPIVADPNNKSAGTGLHIVGNTVNTGTSSHLNGNVINNVAHSDGVYNNKDTVDDEGVVVMSPVSAPSVDMPTSSAAGTSSASGSSVPAPSGGNKTSSSPTIEEFYDDEGEDLENQTSGEDLENQTSGETDGETGDGEDDEAFADLDRVIDELLNFKYKDFSYDPLSDPTYLQYQKQYQRNAQAAMENAAALAATRTGGYGNSYASVASQQAYDAQMDELNDILPQLYEQAYSRHQTEESQRLQQLLNEYTVLAGEREYADGRADVEWNKQFQESQVAWEREMYEKAESDAAAERVVNGYAWAIEQYDGENDASVRAQLKANGYSDTEIADVMSRVQSVYKAGYKSSTDIANEETYKQQVSAWLDAAGKGSLSVSQRDQILGMLESGEMPQADFDKIMDAYSSTVKTELSSGYVFVDEYGDWMVGSDAKSMVEEAMKDKFLSEEVKKRLAKKYNDKYAIYKCVYWNDGNPQPWNAEYSSFGIVLTYGDDEYEMKTIRVTDDDDVILAAAELDDMTVFMKGDTLYVKGDNGKIYELESDNWDASEVKSLLKGKYKEFYTGVNYG